MLRYGKIWVGRVGDSLLALQIYLQPNKSYTLKLHKTALVFLKSGIKSFVVRQSTQ